jgi:hypothetical protein
VETFLVEDVFTNPMFKHNKQNAEKLLKPRYEETPPKRSAVTGEVTGPIPAYKKSMLTRSVLGDSTMHHQAKNAAKLKKIK